jgi:hypothetical protein
MKACLLGVLANGLFLNPQLPLGLPGKVIDKSSIKIVDFMQHWTVIIILLICYIFSTG